MKNKKKQVVAIAIASLLGVCTIVNPITIVGQENNTSIQQRSLHTTIGTSILRNTPTTSYNVGDVAIDGTNFPDATFRGYIKTIFDTDNNGILSATDIANIREIYVNNTSAIANLTGIEKFTSLEYFNCSYTAIEELDVSKNTALIILNCENTAISNLDVSKNTELEYLNCSSTAISNLDVSENKKLNSLYCSDNANLKTLNITGTDALQYLNCASIGITSLDVSDKDNLVSLRCQNDSLSYLNIGTRPSLDDFMYTDTTNVSLKVSEDSFDITQAFLGIDKSKVTNTNGATYDDNSGVVSGYNFNTPIQYTYNCGSINGETKQMNVTLTLSDSSVAIDKTNFPDAIFRKYIKDNFDTNHNDTLSVAEIEAVKTINVSSKKDITSLKGIEKFYNLTTLECYGTSITSLNVSSNVNLTELDCGFTGISSLDVSSNDKLEYLYCDNTGITSLNVSNNKSLKKLWCHSTAITSLDVSSNTNLADLSCSNTHLSYLNIGTNLSGLISTYDNPSKITLEIIGDTFDITKAFKGIDPKKVTLVDGADYNKDSGIVSGYSEYSVETPIHYSYDCGSGKILNVELTLTGIKRNSSIKVTEVLDKIYDGVSVNNTPTIEKTGSTGSVSYTWEKKNGSQWESISVAPTDVGQYRVIASVAEDDNYKSAKSVAVSFVIEPKNVETDNQIKIEEINADTNLDALLIKDGEKVLVQGTDYEVTKKQDGNKVNVTITFKGNYTGMLTRIYVVEDKTPSDKDTNADSVKTGDNTTTELWIMLMTIAAIIVVLKNNKRKEITEE